MIDIERTIISQFANSPTIVRLVQNMNQWFDPRVNFEKFFELVWNVDTADTYGLNVWGKIVGLPNGRLLQISGAGKFFGFSNDDRPFDWQPWGQAPFFAGRSDTQAYELDNTSYRVLILTKALANIVATTSPSLNQLLRNLFPGRGRCYVLDLGGMAMRYVFEFGLSPVEYAILTQSGALPHPASVAFSVVSIPTGGFLGFKQQGPSALPMNFGTFYRPAGV